MGLLGFYYACALLHITELTPSPELERGPCCIRILRYGGNAKCKNNMDNAWLDISHTAHERDYRISSLVGREQCCRCINTRTHATCILRRIHKCTHAHMDTYILHMNAQMDALIHTHLPPPTHPLHIHTSCTHMRVHAWNTHSICILAQVKKVDIVLLIDCVYQLYASHASCFSQAVTNTH